MQYSGLLYYLQNPQPGWVDSSAAGGTALIDQAAGGTALTDGTAGGTGIVEGGGSL